MFQVQSILRNLDPLNTGFINWKQLYTYIILLKSPPPTQADLAVIERLAGEDGYIYEEPFVNTTFWFDPTESSADPENTHPFERRKIVKGLIFTTNAIEVEGKSKPVLDAKHLIDMLSLPGKNKKARDFYDFLFAPVKTYQQ